MKTIGAGQFKAKCLALIDEVADKRQPVTITKNGKARARLVPIEEDDPLAVFRYPGKIEIVGDIVAPVYSEEEQKEFFEHSPEPLK